MYGSFKKQTYKNTLMDCNIKDALVITTPDDAFQVCNQSNVCVVAEG